MQILTDQEFTYRQSPTEEDGLAKITDIKGNTLVWNQLVQNGNFASTDEWVSGGSLTVNNNVASVVSDVTSSLIPANQIRHIANHKYYISVEVKLNVSNGARILLSTALSGKEPSTQSTEWVKLTMISSRNSDISTSYPRLLLQNNQSTQTMFAKNFIMFDLTAMGLDITDPSEFTSLFSKPYYDYCQGAMLSFGGRNVKFNQLVQNGNFADTSNWVTEYTTFTVGNNVASVVGTRNGNNYILQNYQGGGIEHKYYFRCDYYTPDAQTETLLAIYTGSTTRRTAFTPTEYGKWLTYEAIIDNDATDTTQYQIRLQSRKQGVTNQFRNCMVVDLSEMFGAGNEPTIQGFRELFPNDYYEYTTGQYMNLGQPVSLKTVGFNQWDEEWEIGNWRSSDGQSGSLTDRIRSKNYIEVFPSKDYYFKSPVGIFTTICWYDENHAFISSAGGTSTSVNTVFKSPANAKYMRFNMNEVYGTVYNNNICINISSNRNGEYEPYTSSTLSIPLDEFPDGMDGINDARDYKNETGYAKKIAQVDLGSLTWNYRTNGTAPAPYFWASFTDIKSKGNPTQFKANIICSKYNSVRRTVNEFVDGTICADGTNTALTQIQIKDSSYTDVASFKASLDGVILKYEVLVPLENYGVVDFGSLDWTYDSAYTRFYSNGIAQYAKRPISDVNKANILSANYNVLSSNTVTYGSGNMIISLSTAGNIVLRNTAYTDATVFKQAMSGVYLLYEKVNPQGLVYPPQSKEEYPFFKSYKGGTEQLLPENGSVPVTAPILADMNYSSGAIEVTTYPNPEQGGETSGDGWYLVGEEATVNATPNEHYAFNNWVLDGEIVSTDPEYTFEVKDE